MWRDLILAWAKSLVGTYYSFVSIGEEGAGDGPVVAVSNHTNGLIDGVILIRASRRRLRFLAKQELLRMPLLGWIAKGTGAVPVYRKKDNVPTSWNDGVFDEIHRFLARGEAVGVFPEGTSHIDSGIRPLRTGAARVALGAEEAARWSLGVRIVPVGIHYEDRYALGSRVLAIVGSPVAVEPHRSRHRDAPWDTALELTGEIHEALEAIRIELPEQDAAPLIGIVLDELQARTLAPREAPRALRALVEGWQALAQEDEQEARARLSRLRALDAMRRPQGAGKLGFGLARNAGMILWGPPALLTWFLRKTLPLPVDKCTTVLLLAGTLIFPLWLLCVTLVIGALAGAWWGGLAALLLLLSAWSTWAAQRALRRRALPSEAAEERARIVAELSTEPGLFHRTSSTSQEVDEAR